MTDLLTHILVAYVVGTLVSVRYASLTPQHVTLVMLGALVPDLTKIKLLVPSELVQSLLGVPFDWVALHTIGGVAVVIALGTVLAGRTRRTLVCSLLVLGAVSHLLLDGLLLTSSGYSGMLLWPLTSARLPSPGLYLSSDRWPAVVAGTVAVCVWYVRARLDRRA